MASPNDFRILSRGICGLEDGYYWLHKKGTGYTVVKVKDNQVWFFETEESEPLSNYSSCIFIKIELPR